ncbi:hypothetical protein GOODEAATRI_025967 [Goodea atripinnis]|uniref:Uncharacterized protein n=1 Tax=Goodea atripinnis TaxID=208336 RepID=A0ABV0NDZ8_9TELE
MKLSSAFNPSLREQQAVIVRRLGRILGLKVMLRKRTIRTMAKKNHQNNGQEEPSEHETSGAESDDSESLFSFPVQPATPHKPLKVGQRKGEKKAVEVFDIYRVSERMARDLTWGPVQAYIPEAGQRDYHIPAVWADRLEDKVKLRVKATVGEWANILMMPSYHTLATYQPLTSKFRTAYVGVVHDVMLRRLKKAAYKYTQKIE